MVSVGAEIREEGGTGEAARICESTYSQAAALCSQPTAFQAMPGHGGAYLTVSRDRSA